LSSVIYFNVLSQHLHDDDHDDDDNNNNNHPVIVYKNANGSCPFGCAVTWWHNIKVCRRRKRNLNGTRSENLLKENSRQGKLSTRF
jgi:hypothetical protein